MGRPSLQRVQRRPQVLEWSGGHDLEHARPVESDLVQGLQDGRKADRPAADAIVRPPRPTAVREVHLPEPRCEEAERPDVILSDGLGVRDVVRDPQPRVVERTDEPLEGVDRRDRRPGVQLQAEQLVRLVGVREQRLHALDEPALALPARGLNQGGDTSRDRDDGAGAELGREPDGFAVELDGVDPECIVADVVVHPEMTKLLTAAHERGCFTQPGVHMMDGQITPMAAFLGLGVGIPLTVAVAKVVRLQ